MIKLASDFGDFVNQIRQTAVPPDISAGIDPKSVITPQQFYFNLILYAIYILAAVAVIVIIFAGIKYITAGADEEKVASAKRTIIGAVIGIIIMMSSLAIYNFVIGALSK